VVIHAHAVEGPYVAFLAGVDNAIATVRRLEASERASARADVRAIQLAEVTLLLRGLN